MSEVPLMFGVCSVLSDRDSIGLRFPSCLLLCVKPSLRAKPFTWKCISPTGWSGNFFMWSWFLTRELVLKPRQKITRKWLNLKSDWNQGFPQSELYWYYEIRFLVDCVFSFCIDMTVYHQIIKRNTTQYKIMRRKVDEMKPLRKQ